MPSDVKASDAATLPETDDTATEPIVEPPSAKLLVRLFLIPLLIVGAAVGVMFLIGLLYGSPPSFDEALAGLEKSGGERTAEWLLGPGSKQRYIYAKALTDRMKSGMNEKERIMLASRLRQITAKAGNGEGDVKHFLLLAIGRTWQFDPAQEPMTSTAAAESRMETIQFLLDQAKPVDPPASIAPEDRIVFDAQELRVRKAAVLALVYLSGWSEVQVALSPLSSYATDSKEALDVRLAAVTALGPLARPTDAPVIEALHTAMHDDDPRNAELVWGSALSLAQLKQSDVAPQILMLLSRSELAQKQYYDREEDPKNPQMRVLREPEIERILINTMIGARDLDAPDVQARIKDLAENDPSDRVKQAAEQVLRSHVETAGK